MRSVSCVHGRIGLNMGAFADVLAKIRQAKPITQRSVAAFIPAALIKQFPSCSIYM